MEQVIDYSTLSTEQLIQLEKEYADETARLNSIQMALKICLNSLYGALGNNSFRYFDVRLASSVTTSGQHAIKWIERKLNELIDRQTGISKDRVVLIDTDSVVLDLEDLVNQRCPNNLTREQKLKFLDVLGEKVLHPYIAKSYDELGDYMNAYKHKFKMKRENIINTMISVAAKSYMMEVYNSEGVQYTLEHPYMKIMGLQLVKSSLPKVVREGLRNAIPIILHGKESELQQYIKQQREAFSKLDITQVAFPRSITNITKYNPTNVKKIIGTVDEKTREKLQNALDNGTSTYILGTPIHVRASLIYNSLIDKYQLSGDYQKIGDGDKVRFVYLTTPNPINEDVIGFIDEIPSQWGLQNYIDYNKMFDKTFVSAIEKMITPINWSPEKVNTLIDWFSF